VEKTKTWLSASDLEGEYLKRMEEDKVFTFQYACTYKHDRIEVHMHTITQVLITHARQHTL